MKEQTAHRPQDPTMPGGEGQASWLGVVVAPASRVMGMGEQGLAVQPNGGGVVTLERHRLSRSTRWFRPSGHTCATVGLSTEITMAVSRSRCRPAGSI